AKAWFVIGECLGDAVTNCTGLTGKAATNNSCDNIELTSAVRRNDWLLQDHLQNRTCEIRSKFFAVYGDLAGTWLDPNASNRVFTLAGRISAALSVDLLNMNRSGLFGDYAAEFFERVELLSHDYAFPLCLRFSAATSRTSGCCASC